MSRLIDADAFTESLIHCDGLGRKSFEAVLNVLKKQPTAYDVSKVVAELEQQVNQYNRRARELVYKDTQAGIRNKSKAYSYEHAIDIVKRGGMNTVIEMNDTALSDGIAMIVFDDKCITKYIDAEYDAYLDFQEALDIAKRNGYTEGVILLICEDALKGKIYKYNNYGNGKWHEAGTTYGYA